MRHLLGTTTLENVINELVFSRLYYCSPVWSSTTKKNISKLQKIQNFAARMITNTRKFDYITPVFQELRWLHVSYFLTYTVGVLAFNCLKGLVPSCMSVRFVTRCTVHDRNTRKKDYLNIPAYQSAAGQRTFLYRAIKLWNSLPREITAADSLRTFKRKLREFLFESFLVS